jgi:simple sugar transport system ATP-binding protein
VGERVLEVRNITKRFPGVLAVDDVSLHVQKGEILALLGENGAGKTTLMNVAYGLLTPDAGEVLVDGEVHKIDSPRRAIDLRIGMVHQHFMLVEPFTVAENIVLGREPTRIPVLHEIDFVSTRRVVEELSDRYGLKVDPDAKIVDLSVGMQQRVEILKALYRNVNILILDEPTAVLTPQEVTELFEVVRSLVAEGLSVVFITHKLEEVVNIADRVVVMRDGSVVGETRPVDTDQAGLAKMMVGREVVFRIAKKPPHCGGSVLEVAELVVENDRRIEAVRGVSFDVCAGEIVAIAGVSGNGQTELVEALTGLRAATKGTVSLKERDITKMKTRDRIAAGVSHVPEDRQRRGLILEFDLPENLILGDHRRPPFAKRGIMQPRAITQTAKERIAEYDVRTPSERVLASTLSGGNQQKVILARELGRNPELLIAAQPTRGLDVGAIEFVHKEILRERDAGKGILLISLELEEVQTLADRILVMYEGRIVKEFVSGEATDEEIGYYMTGGGHAKLDDDADGTVSAGAASDSGGEGEDG